VPAESVPAGSPEAVPEAARVVFGDRVDLAVAFVELLRAHGEARGLIGPREVARLWDRHVLNSAVLADVIPRDATVVDVGSGGGFPGVPLAVARGDLAVTLLEPMARRVDWLQEVVESLGLEHVTVVRGRAEEKATRAAVGAADVATARAVAPLAKLAGWCLPLVKPGGRLLAIKGASAAEEVDRDRAAVLRAGGADVEVLQCGAGILEVPTTVVAITAAARRTPTRRRSR
jgi:16S rRNA (guanine527-N7)-methyltransferase